MKKFKLLVLFLTLFSLNSVYACDKNKAGSDSKVSTESAGDKIAAYQVGDVIENFTLATPEGSKISLDDMNDSKARVLIFWSVQCPVVQAYSDRVVSLSNEYREKGVEIIPIYPNTTESTEEVKEHIASRNYDLKIMMDEDHKITNMFGATKTPEVYLIDENNVLVYKGRVDDSQNESKISSRDLKNALDELIAGNEITVKETKAFGCSIK
jgi:peroxiredoxin